MKVLQSRAAVALSLSAGTALCLLVATSAQSAPQRGGGRPSSGAGSVAARPTPNATARPTAVPRATPVAGARDLQLLAGALGRTLTTAEQTAISAAATARDTGAKTAVSAFETAVAGLFDLSSSELQGKINSYCKGNRNAARGSLADVIAGALGRELTDDETAALAELTETRDAAIEVSVETYRQTVADTLDLTIAEVDAKIQAYLATQRGGGRGRRGGSGSSTTTGTNSA